ncbi:MAG: deoxyribodipyrimidine photo-lyase [Frankiales bacterium]|nr:deoxyribodipyrimidine photo-lyase [Frankiales bacterium]
MTTALLWFRRDLRLADHPALLAARDAADEVVPVFVLDDVLLKSASPVRVGFLVQALTDLRSRTDGALRIVQGAPADVIPDLVQRSGASSVHISSDYGPYGSRRDAAVKAALGKVPLVATGSPYGVSPGTLLKDDGTPYRVYTPFLKAWRARGVHSPALTPRSVTWSDGGLRTDALPAAPEPVIEATEAAALARWTQFRDTDLESYHEIRDLPGVDRTSRLSPYLKWGLLHPRTLHADLGSSAGAEVYGKELVWRDFYADVLHHQPQTAREDLNPLPLEYDEPGALFEAWKQGRTGYPIVDAGMRQLLAQGWVHNRVRMIVASFLTKDLHVWWPHGGRHFMQHLLDADLASNQHGWQWTAGTGTDASPYFRVFNPVTQGRKFDPSGDYIRRWVPELRELSEKHIHEPWTCERPPADYPARVVDHAAERQESLDRYQRARGK